MISSCLEVRSNFLTDDKQPIEGENFCESLLQLDNYDAQKSRMLLSEMFAAIQEQFEDAN